MALFDPWQFSIQVCNRWDEIPQLRIRPRPKMEFLAQVLETAFVASMETEEGRHLTFGLLLRANTETDDPDHVIARFVEKRKLTTNEICRLAPATSEPSTFIAIDESLNLGNCRREFRMGKVSICGTLIKHGTAVPPLH